MSQFPELQSVGQNFVAACQALGLGLLAAMICLLALLIFTSLGNEHRQVYARLAAFGLLVGFALLMAAPTIASVIERIFPVVPPK
jgi:hypothetical protein